MYYNNSTLQCLYDNLSEYLTYSSGQVEHLYTVLYEVSKYKQRTANKPSTTWALLKSE